LKEQRVADKIARTNRDLTEGNIIKNMWHLALPMMAANLLHNVFNIVDMFFVGKLGPEAIAAVAMSGILLGVIWTGIMGVSVGTVAMVARFFGARDFEGANSVTTQSLLLGILGSIPITIFGYLLAEPILRLLGAQGEVLSLGISYLRIISLGSITVFLYFLLSSALRGAGDAVTPLKILILCTILNIILDPLFIFGLWVFPRWEVAGSAFATVLSRGLGMIILLYLLLRGRSLLHISLKGVRLDFEIIWRITRIGIFGSIQMLMWTISDLIFIRIVAIYGTFALAAYGIGMRIIFTVMMPGFGLAQAAATMVGQNLGAGKPKRAEKSAWISTGFYEIFMVISAAVFFLWSRDVVKFFSSDPEVISMGETYMRLVALSFVFIALSIVLGRAMMGAGDTLSPTIITGISLFLVRIPLALFLAQTRDLGTLGLWAGIAASNLAQGLFMTFWFTRGRWKNKVV